ncbi:MAG: SH3 domain-containing protein [Rhizobiaceae bacterium]|nr:SH3 domain-containing protein [Rhizobiaceae bacterium]
MTRPHAFPALLSLLLLTTVSAGAQTAAPDSSIVEVTGIAPNDLLNIRANASVGGLVIARFENGARFLNLGCADVSGVSWCKVQSVDDPRIMGWTAARYLIEATTGGIEEMPSTEGDNEGAAQ